MGAGRDLTETWPESRAEVVYTENMGALFVAFLAVGSGVYWTAKRARGWRSEEASLKRCLAITAVSIVAIAACAFVFRDRPWEAERVYREYDQEFRAYLAHANESIGKEVIKVERLSDRFTVPQKLTIHGTPHEIGLAIGHVAKQAGSRPPMVAPANLELNRKMAEVYQRIYPEQLEVVRGVAEVFEKPAERIDLVGFERDFTTPLWTNLLKLKRFEAATDFSQLASDAEPFKNQHCSAASYFADNHHFVGLHFDHASDRPTFFTTQEMTGCYKAIGHTVYELTGELVDGMNEKGFALCVASNNDGKYCRREPYPSEPAIVMWHMMQILLHKCATVDEALSLLQDVRVWFPDESNHWLIADATGKAAVVEWSPSDHKLVVFDAPGPYKLMTNMACQEGEDSLVKNCFRYAAAKPLLEKGVHDSTEMFAVLESMRIKRGPGRSLWTAVMDLNAKTMQVRYFKEFERKYTFGF
jgi:hypothetical protein